MMRSLGWCASDVGGGLNVLRKGFLECSCLMKNMGYFISNELLKKFSFQRHGFGCFGGKHLSHCFG